VKTLQKVTACNLAKMPCILNTFDRGLRSMKYIRCCSCTPLSDTMNGGVERDISLKSLLANERIFFFVFLDRIVSAPSWLIDGLVHVCPIFFLYVFLFNDAAILSFMLGYLISFSC